MPDNTVNEKRLAALRTIAGEEGYGENVTDMLSDHLRFDTEGGWDLAALPRYLVCMYDGNTEEWTLADDLREAYGYVEEEVMYGREVGPIRDLDEDTGQVSYDVRVEVTEPGQGSLDYLRVMHKMLYPERYDEGDYQWDSETIEHVASLLIRALAYDDSTQLEAGERKQAKTERAVIESARGGGRS